MKGKILNKLKKYWVTIWLIVAISSLAIIISYAAYTRISTAKRVISTEAGENILFSSNYMQQSRKTTNEVADPLSFTTTNPVYIMNVCNFAQGNRGSWFYKTINYTLTAQLVDKSKNPAAASGKTFTIKKKGSSDTATDLSDGTAHTIGTTHELKYDRLKEAYDEYEITLDKSELQSTSPNFYVLITATPTDTFGGAIPVNISGYVGVSQGNSENITWTGFIEDQGLSTNTYHGYNFVLQGSGKGTVKFAWNPAYLDISEISVSTNSLPNPTDITIDGTSYKQIEMSVDSDIKSRYEINFFKKSGVDYGSSAETYLQFVSFEKPTPEPEEPGE